jgi:ADP-heptose:LPS heptosyltransferase
MLVVVVPHFMGSYAPRQYLRLLEPLNIVVDNTTKTLAISSAAKEKADAFLKQLPAHSLLAGIAPSTGSKIKEWPAERFALVADYLVEKHNAVIVVLGGKRDSHEVEEMMRNVTRKNRVLSTLDLFSIDELKAVVQRLELFISADTGPIYIAEAFGVATVDIVGPMDEKEQPPIGTRHKVVAAPRHKPELHIMNARVYDAREARRQAEAITVQMVLAEVEELIRNT